MLDVQRIFIHEQAYDAFRHKLVAASRDLKSGNPKDDETFIGPIIPESEAARLHGWIEDAMQRGATLLCGGKREGATQTFAIGQAGQRNICCIAGPARNF